jgi:hypothetical protein
MTWFYNFLRTFSRGLAAGAVAVLLNGKAAPFGVTFEAGTALLLALGLFGAAWLTFQAESWAKVRAGL